MAISLVMAPPARAAPRPTVLTISQANASQLAQLQDYPDLTELSISCLDKREPLPETIGALAKLKVLKVDNGNGCRMSASLPESIGQLEALETLIWHGAQNLQRAFPRSLSRLTALRVLDLGGNRLTALPGFVAELHHLQELRLDFNRLTSLPDFLGELRELRVLALGGNDLDDLPDSFSKLPAGVAIALGNNCKITRSKSKPAELRRRFPKIHFDFADEFDCPED
jgi:Leucine-rich repeat (LRR) protein